MLLALNKLAKLLLDGVVLLLQFLALIAADAAPLRNHLVVHADDRVEAVRHDFLISLYSINGTCLIILTFLLPLVIAVLGEPRKVLLVLVKLSGHCSSGCV